MDGTDLKRINCYHLLISRTTHLINSNNNNNALKNKHLINCSYIQNLLFTINYYLTKKKKKN